MHLDDYRIPFDGTFRVADAYTLPPEGVYTEKQLRSKLGQANKKLYNLQRKLYAHNKYAVLMIFQAMDAAGKDSTILHVMKGVNPAGCQVFSFKEPSSEELQHDFLWRSAVRLPERGRIGIFNRSYYEETLVTRVHPEYLERQNLPPGTDMDAIWESRFQSIREHERHLHECGTRIIKFWLNVSRGEQKARFLNRLRNPRKNWKFSRNDLAERAHWDEYMRAYESMLNATSREYGPWYAIPADNKGYMRLIVARILIQAIENLQCHYPEAPSDIGDRFREMEALLENEPG